MRALELTSKGLQLNSNFEAAEIPGEIPVRVLKAGICETDLQLVQGYMNFQGVLGHEFVGVAEAGKYAGQRVVGEINCPCGSCERCRQGLGNHCPRRSVLGILNRMGAFADQVWLPEANLHLVPESVSDEQAVFVEPLAAAFQIPAQLDLKKFDKVMVLGDGRLGNLCAQVLKERGCDPLVIGKHSHKLNRLRDLEIRTALLSEQNQSPQADLVVDCTGSEQGFLTACRFVRPRGTVVLKTTVAGDRGPNLAPVVIDEITVVGSRCGPFPDALQALAVGRIDVNCLLTSTFELDEGLTAFETARQPDQLKVLLNVA